MKFWINPDTKELEQLPLWDKREGSHYIDGLLSKNLLSCRQQIKNDWDYLFIVDGEVGSGKSVFVSQLAWFCSGGDIPLDRVAFKASDFQKGVIAAPKYSAVVFDEAFRGLSSRNALGMMNKKVIEMLNEIRQKNLFVFIVMPSAWDLDSHVLLFRTKGTFNIYTDTNKQRGFWKFYQNNTFYKQFFSDRRNRYSYPKFPSLPAGRFMKKYGWDEVEYLKKKMAALNTNTGIIERLEGATRAGLKETEMLKIAQNIVYEFPRAGFGAISRATGISSKQLRIWNDAGEFSKHYALAMSKKKKTPDQIFIRPDDFGIMDAEEGVVDGA